MMVSNRNLRDSKVQGAPIFRFQPFVLGGVASMPRWFVLRLRLAEKTVPGDLGRRKTLSFAIYLVSPKKGPCGSWHLMFFLLIAQ